MDSRNGLRSGVCGVWVRLLISLTNLVSDYDDGFVFLEEKRNKKAGMGMELHCIA